MPVPSLIQSTDPINAWFDATNNLISHVVNTSAFVLVGNTAVGNVGINGVTSLSTLNVNTSSNIAGTNMNVSANLAHTGSNALFTSNVTISSTTFTVSANAHLTGLFTNVTGYLRVANNAIFANTLAVTGNVVFSNTLAVTGNTVLSNTLAVTGNAIFNNVVSFLGDITVNAASITGALTTNNALTLSGPFMTGAGFVLTPTTLSGAGAQADLANNITGYSNTVIYRVSSDQAKPVSGLYIVDATKYRQITLLNVGNFDITLLHANTGSVANNRFLCPSNTNFTLSAQGAVNLIYDANTSVQRWRVMGTSSVAATVNAASYATYAPDGGILISNTSTTGINASAISVGTVGSAYLPVANTTANGIVTFADQTFGGAKRFANAMVLPVGTNKWAT